MLTYREADLRGPLVVVVGSEGQGIGPAIRRRLDLTVRIPMHGRIASLNAAVAGSVLLLEAAGQRDPTSPTPGEGAASESPAAASPGGSSTSGETAGDEVTSEADTVATADLPAGAEDDLLP